MKAVYINHATQDTYTLYGEDMTILKASNLIEFACQRNGWRHFDVTFKVVAV
jgi:hypothetical protein